MFKIRRSLKERHFVISVLFLCLCVGAAGIFFAYVNSRSICFGDVLDSDWYFSQVKSIVNYLGKTFDSFSI